MGTRIDELKKLLTEEPNDAFLHYALGLEYLAKQYYQEALGAFGQCLQLDEEYLAAYYQMAQIFIMLDITDVAATYIQKGITLAEKKRDPKTRAELEELLESIS